jgi:hypothetical protein
MEDRHHTPRQEIDYCDIILLYIQPWFPFSLIPGCNGMKLRVALCLSLVYMDVKIVTALFLVVRIDNALALHCTSNAVS